VSDSVQRMEELLARARAADADVARVREGAKPAGEADPYRVSGDADGPDGEGADDDDQLED
jgi:ribosome-binding factor A